MLMPSMSMPQLLAERIDAHSIRRETPRTRRLIEIDRNVADNLYHRKLRESTLKLDVVELEFKVEYRRK